jgi:ribosome recycling factor
VQDDFSAVRTGKASPQLVDSIRVDCSGTVMQLRELAGITCPEPRLIVIQPWDGSNVDPIRKALEVSTLGITPMIDGKIIRVPIPELSEERRRDLIKVVRNEAEGARVAVRNIRRDARKVMETAEKNGEMSKDDLERAERDLDKITHDNVDLIDKALTRKEQELLEV